MQGYVLLQSGICKSKLLFYITDQNKKCQKTAWSHHHKYECKTFAAIKSMQNPGDDSEHTMIFSSHLRLFIRLVQLHRNNKLAPAYNLDDFYDLASAGAATQLTSDQSRLHQSFAEMVKHFIDTELTYNDLERLLLSVSKMSEALMPDIDTPCADPLGRPTYMVAYNKGWMLVA